MINFIIESFPIWKSSCLIEETYLWNKTLDFFGVNILYYNIGKNRIGEYNMFKKPSMLVEDFHPDNSFGNLAYEASQQGCNILVKENVFNGDELNFFHDGEIVLCQTSLGLALRIQKETNWNPGPWLTAENYECVKYYPILQESGIPLFNGKCKFYTRKNIEQNINSIIKEYGEKESNRIFIRPSSGLKTFTGMVFQWREPYWSQDWFWVEEGTNDSDILMVASPVGHYDRIVAEWRFIASDKEIISGSQYMKESEKEYSEVWEQEAYELAFETAQVFQPDPMYTIDICKTANDKFYVMELNSFSCAGLYGCDLKPVVERMIDITRNL